MLFYGGLAVVGGTGGAGIPLAAGPGAGKDSTQPSHSPRLQQ